MRAPRAEPSSSCPSRRACCYFGPGDDDCDEETRATRGAAEQVALRHALDITDALWKDSRARFCKANLEGCCDQLRLGADHACAFQGNSQWPPRENPRRMQIWGPT